MLLIKYVGCSKCNHAFERHGDRTNYTGFDCNSWETRSSEEHKRDALRSKNAATATERKEIEKETGARYSELHRLPYYDPIRMHTIDPMHNLYLRTAKHIFVTRIDIGVLSSENLSEIDARMNNIKLPTDIGRIPG